MHEGLLSLSTHHSVTEVVSRLESLLAAKSVKLFAIIDHSGEAAAAGLTMPETRVVIFGNPLAGTPIMLATPSTALDLPLKILIAATATGSLLTWNDPAWLQQRHGFPGDLRANLDAVTALAHAAAAD